MKSTARILAAIALTVGMSIAGATSAQASSPKWLQIASGYSHTCAIRTDHTLYCWGDNGWGQLGIGNKVEQPSPVKVGTSNSWKSVAAGGSITCALRTSGALYCWGYNDEGAVGTGENVLSYSKPARVGSSTSWKSVSVGDDHTCALHASGSIYCWGFNPDGRIGQPTSTNLSLSPLKVGSSTSWTSVEAGGDFTCARHSSGSLYCWGNGTSGRLGNGGTSGTSSPTKIGSSTSWKGVSAGEAHACALHSSGAIYCWGDNYYGQTGSVSGNHSSPTKIGSSTSWTNIAAGGGHNCARHSSGAIYCWGDNTYGELGDGSTGTNRNAPHRVGDLTNWHTPSLGNDHACALNTSGYAYCWGSNEYGQLGIDSAAPSKSTPQKITGVATSG